MFIGKLQHVTVLLITNMKHQEMLLVSLIGKLLSN